MWDLHIAPTKLAELYTDDIHEGDVLERIDCLRAKRYAPGKGKVTKRKGSKDWAYSKATIRGYFRVLRTILVAAGAGAACANIRGKGKLKLAPIGDVKKAPSTEAWELPLARRAEGGPRSHRTARAAVVRGRPARRVRRAPLG